MKVEAFAAERRERLTVGDDALRPAVQAALGRYLAGEADWFDGIVTAAGQIWLENFEAEAPGATYAAALRRFQSTLSDSLEKTSPPAGQVADAQVERITRWVSTYVVNAGTIQGAYARGVRFKLWVDMNDAAVRETHQTADGQVVPIGSAFTVGGHKLAYPGEPVGPLELWIECRCVAMPAARTGETMSTHTFELDPQAVDIPVEKPETDESEERTGALVVLLPAADDPVVAASSEDIAHMTTVWFGDVNEMTVDLEELEQAVRLYAQDLDGPVVVPVSQVGTLGDDEAQVAYLEPTDSIVALRDGMLANEPIRAAHDAVEQFPEWTPHVTLGYPEGVEGGPPRGEYDGTEVTFDRIGLWLGSERTEYPMGGTVDTITADATVDEELPEPGIPAEDYVADDEPEDGEELPTEIPVHGVLAPEGVETGDGRGFRPGALSARPMPLPLRLEIIGSHGGNQTSEVVTVGRIDEAWKDEATSQWRFRGAIILTKPYAQQAIEGIVDQSGRGVSIDADAMSVDMAGMTDEAMAAAAEAGRNPTTWFSETRVAGLTIVPIPAFHEAYVGLGPDFEEDMSDEDRAAADAILADCGCGGEFRDVSTDERKRLAGDGNAMPDGSYPIANEEDLRNAIQAIGRAKDPDAVKAHIKKRARALGHPELIPENWAASVEAFAPGTKDGPGWITHPIPTSRIRRYWVSGEGAAKIAWGTPGDFNRCRAQLAKYVQNPDWLAGLCANMHKEALGVWPGQEGGNRGRHALIASGGPPAPIFTWVEEEPETITAAAGYDAFPSEWFANPRFTGVTPMTVDKATGRVYGHLAQWGVCHIGVAGKCVQAPRSTSGYANFLKGLVTTTAGDQPVGCLTYGIGHANPQLRAAAATAHYDRPDAVIAYVNIGEDQHGIWYAGVLRPGVDARTVDEFRAVGAISGDWRPVGRWGHELVAAVGVNTPGYPVSIAAGGAIIAAGMVLPAGEETTVAYDDEENDAFLARVVVKAVEMIDSQRQYQQRLETARARALSLRITDARARASKGA